MLSERALERRLKRHLRKERQAYFIPCLPGFEDVLAGEVRQLAGASDVSFTHGGVGCMGSLDLVYHANLHIATGQRVLLRIGEYLAQTFPMLFDHLRRIHWELYLGFAQRYTVRVSSSESRLNLEARIVDTLADAIRARYEELAPAPSPAGDAPTGIHLRVFRDRCTVSIDTSGAHLHRRGIRTHVGVAPLRETIAAACLMAAGVERATRVVDPFCGSGALVVEAARVLSGIPAGAERTFAFEAMPFFQRSKWERFRAEARSAALPVREARIEASDLDEHALRALQANLDALGPAVPVPVTRVDAFEREWSDPGSDRAVIVSNLPYGRRVLSPAGAEDLALRFADLLRARAAGWEAALVTAHPGAFTGPPFRVVRRNDFRNGGLRVSFLHLEVRPGSAA